MCVITAHNLTHWFVVAQIHPLAQSCVAKVQRRCRPQPERLQIDGEDVAGVEQDEGFR